MTNSFRPRSLHMGLLASALLLAAAPAFAQGGSTSGGTPSPQRPVAAAPATPAAPHGQVTQRPAQTGAQTGAQAGAVQGNAATPARPAQPSGTAATTPAPTAPRTN